MSKHQLRGAYAVLAATLLCSLPLSASAAQLRIIQTNFAGDTIHVIDPATNKVVAQIGGVEAAHGIVTSPDGARIYLSEEVDDTLNVIDGKTLKFTKKIKLSGNPNLIDITPDGKTIYVAIALSYSDLSDFPRIKPAASGGVDVIDTASLQLVKTIPIKSGVHDLNVTPDGKYVIVGNARGGKANVMTVVDTQSNEIAWTMPMTPSPSPMAVSKNPDGSTKSIFAQNGSDNGFQVVDFATRKITNTIKLPNITDQAQNPYGPPAASHGIAVTPDQKTLLVNSRFNSALYSYSLPDLKFLGVATLGGKGAGWLTITPDGKTAYVANEHTNDVSVVDIKSMKEVTRIPVGFAPARNIVWMAP
ncbi:MAG TPA: beta-propeller fold lactonase family protein [Micropepsaceae bacterium]|nr:beta-propeller fold lactonase family protein [Micropepsaceae bacterium]